MTKTPRLAMRRLTAIGAFSLSVIVASLAITPAVADDPIVLRMADAQVPGEPSYESQVWFHDEVKKRTNGRVEIQYFPNSQLGTDKQYLPAILAGTLDMGKSSAGNFADFSDALSFAQLPGIVHNPEHMRAIWDSDIREEVAAQIKADTGLTVIQFDIDGGAARALAYKGDPIRTLDDMKGRKFRSTGAPVEMALFQAWGVNATPIAWGELYTALQQRVVDGLYGHPPGVFTSGMVEVVDNLTIVNMSYITSIRVMSKQAVEKLGGEGSELLEIVLQVAREAEHIKDEMNREELKTVKERYASAGVGYFELTREELQPWREAAQTVWADFVGSKISPDLIARIEALSP